MNRADFLFEARKCICEDRNTSYGEPEDNFSTIAEFWSTYLSDKLNSRITAMDVGCMMDLFKVARIKGGATLDSFVDAIGYMACAGEIFHKAELTRLADEA